MSNWTILLIALYPFFVSPVAMLVIRQTLERGDPAGIFDVKTQSWAFLFGDTFSLPLTVLWALRTIRDSDMSGSVLYQWWWAPASVFVGIGAATGFRKLDTAAYKASGNEDRLLAPTKLWHDYAVYMTVGALVFSLAVPALLTRTVDGYITAMWFSTFIVFGACDMIRKIKPEHLHPRVQDTALARFA